MALGPNRKRLSKFDDTLPMQTGRHPTRHPNAQSNQKIYWRRNLKNIRKLTSLMTLMTLSVIALIVANPAQAQDHDSLRTKAVILVHGAWADGSSWSKVIPLLERGGFHVTAVQLPLTSIADDVATVARAIALAPGPVLLVGHSYGGIVITEAGNDAKVAGLVYVSAYAPDAGQSALSLNALVPVHSGRG